MSVARLIRKRLPAAWQPPVRFLYERARGLLEREMSIVASVVQRGDRVADVGANNGLYTHLLAKRGAFVEAFEPQPECVAVLRAYASRRPHRNVRVHSVALSSSTGVAALHLPRGSAVSPSASLRATPASDAVLEVALEPLDSFEFADLRLMKIDVEGAELDVLRGAAETLRRCRPLLFVEIEQRHHREPISEVFREVTSFGYDGVFLDDAGHLRPLSSFDVARWQGAEARQGNHAEPYINNFFFSPTLSEARRWPT